MRRRSAAAAAVAAAVVLGTASTSAARVEPGDLLAFTGWVGQGDGQSLLTVDTATGRVREVAPGGIGSLTWTVDGQRLVWTGYDERRDGRSTLYSSRPDGSDRRTLMTGSDVSAPAAAPDGSLAVVRAEVRANPDCAVTAPLPRAEIVVLDPQGRERVLRSVPSTAFDLVFSPDGSVLLWRAYGPDGCAPQEQQVHLTDVAGGATRQVTGDARNSGWPTFSGDGGTVVTARSDELGQDLVRTDVASATSVRLRTPDFAESLPVFSPDGTRLAMVRTPGVPEQGIVFRPSGPPRIVVTDASGRLLQDLGPAPVVVEHLAWSPDGTSLALDGYTSVPACEGCDYGSADPAVWTVPLDGRGPRLLTTAGGFAGAGLAFRPVVPDPPVVERRLRQVR